MPGAIFPLRDIILKYMNKLRSCPEKNLGKFQIALKEESKMREGSKVEVMAR
jgi:hypothetical protein